MLPFAKMNGIGNAILVVDERGAETRIAGAAARRLCRGDLAFDQLMVVSDPRDGACDAAVRIYNADGSRAGACGNGTRCVAWFMSESGSGDAIALDIDGTRVSCRRNGAWSFTVDMGAPRFGWQDIPLREATDTDAVDLGAALDRSGLGAPAAVDMGNPHAVFFVPDAAAIDLAAWGPRVERHPLFPDRVNVSFAQVLAPDAILLRVWERGAGMTLACGSAACATLVAAVRRGLVERAARIALPGGDLAVQWRDDDHVLMGGPVALEHRGQLDPATGATAPWR